MSDSLMNKVKEVCCCAIAWLTRSSKSSSRVNWMVFIFHMPKFSALQYSPLHPYGLGLLPSLPFPYVVIWKVTSSTSISEYTKIFEKINKKRLFSPFHLCQKLIQTIVRIMDVPLSCRFYKNSELPSFDSCTIFCLHTSNTALTHRIIESDTTISTSPKFFHKNHPIITRHSTTK